jgi:GDPmannose 4,6-dehydratase
MSKVALITGITGQDGSYLAEFLLSKGYIVHGLIRRASTFNTKRIDHIYQDPHDPGCSFFLHYGDVLDSVQLFNLISSIHPDEIYHLASQSHVRVSFEIPDYTGEVTGLGTARILEVLRRSRIPARLYQASSSEMFGNAPAPQNERTPFMPKSPYAAAKVYAHWMTVNYREAYGLYTCSGILFNHESPRRGETFVTRKITRAIADIVAGKQKRLYLGNLDARRDWGLAPEYVEAMWMMLQQETPCDLVIGTGKAYSVRDFLEEAFTYVNLNWRDFVEVDPRYLRPIDVDLLVADPTEARRRLGWSPRITFQQLVRIMVDADLEAAGITPPGEGKRILDGSFGWLRRP